MKCQNTRVQIQTARAAEGSDNIAMVYLHFLTTAAGDSATEAPCSTSTSHCIEEFKLDHVIEVSLSSSSTDHVEILKLRVHTHIELPMDEKNQKDK